MLVKEHALPVKLDRGAAKHRERHFKDKSLTDPDGREQIEFRMVGARKFQRGWTSPDCTKRHIARIDQAPFLDRWSRAVDGPITTASAAMAQMDLMLALVARHAGASLADDCARYLLLDARRSQSRYMAISFLAANEPHVAKAAKWAGSRLSEPFSIDDLASAAGLSARTFARRVHEATRLSPIRFLQRLRMDAAMELLETTKLPFDAVAHQVGYSDPSTLRRILSRDANRRPGELRA